MSSIFEDIDQEVNPGPNFWTPLESFVLDDISQNSVISGPLKQLQKSGLFKTRHYILTTSSLYRCRKSSENPKNMTIVKWKKVEAFTEENQFEERFGFKLGHSHNSQDFYLDSAAILESWLVALSHVAIMIELEEDYAIIKEIGRGNYATVFCAENLESHTKFAVKQINKEVVYKSSRGSSAVISEIEIMRKLNHPFIVKLFSVYENETFVSLVLEYVEGGDLYQRVQKKMKFSESVSAKFIQNMLEILKYIHSLNIVHRDIKPENILMTSLEEDSEFKLCDFGLACISGDDQVLRCGSPGYVAPEILMKKKYNNKVDVFSAGIILFIILSGRAPFYGRNANEILAKNRECVLVFNQKYWGGLSKECICFVGKLTELEPGDRFSAEQALRHPWILNATKRMDLLNPVILTRSEDDRGAENQCTSFLLVQRIADRREMGADIS